MLILEDVAHFGFSRFLLTHGEFMLPNQGRNTVAITTWQLLVTQPVVNSVGQPLRG